MMGKLGRVFPPSAAILGGALAALLTAACTGKLDTAAARQCSNDLAVAYKELDIAEAEGFSGTVDWAKAASLLAAARVQHEFEHYPNCIEKVQRARVYIKRSKSG